MLSLITVRRLCAALDTVALTAIAANFSKQKPHTRTNADFPAISVSTLTQQLETISTAEASEVVPVDPSIGKPETHPEDTPTPNWDSKQSSVPALIKIKNERDPEKLFHLFKSNAHNRLVVENRFAFEDTVSRLAGARRFDLIEHLLEHQKALPQGRREGFIVRIIMLYGKAKMPDHALQTFYQMHLYKCPRTVKSFNATLRALSLNRRFDDVRTLFGEIPTELGISLDGISYNLLIKVLCEVGSLESAYLAMVEMEKAGIKPDVVTYTTLISAFYEHDRREIGDGLWNLMAIKGCLPNLATFNARIQFLINKRRGWQARRLMQTMAYANLKPDELTHNLIIKGFFKMGEPEMAKMIFFTLDRRGCKPNSRIYQTMVHYLCEVREFDLAFRLCKDGMERNWFPNIDTISKLLEGLVTILKDQNAGEIMKLVRGREPPYLVDEMRTFLAKLSLARAK